MKKDKKSAILYYEIGAKRVSEYHAPEIYLKAAQLAKELGDSKTLTRIVRDAIPVCRKSKQYGIAAKFAEMKGNVSKARHYSELNRVLN